MTVADDLATLRRCPEHGIPDCSPLLNGCSWNNDPRRVAADGVEAELARLEREHEAAIAAAMSYRREREAAKAEIKRLRDGLREIAEADFHAMWQPGPKSMARALLADSADQESDGPTGLRPVIPAWPKYPAWEKPEEVDK